MGILRNATCVTELNTGYLTVFINVYNTINRIQLVTVIQAVCVTVLNYKLAFNNKTCM